MLEYIFLLLIGCGNFPFLPFLGHRNDVVSPRNKLLPCPSSLSEKTKQKVVTSESSEKTPFLLQEIPFRYFSLLYRF